MANGVKDVALVPVDMSQELVKLASDPNFNPQTLQALIAMHERAASRLAEENFNAAMSVCQQQLGPISAKANNPQTKSKYATYAAVDHDVRPVYTANGFALSFDTGDCPLPQHVRVLCYVTHASGHSKTYHADMPADGKGAKGGDVMTLTHAAGAAMSYGRRYLVGLIFNLAFIVGEADKDGNYHDERPDPPKDYVKWKPLMESAAMQGAVGDVWRAALPQYRTYATNHDKDWLSQVREAAKQAARS